MARYTGSNLVCQWLTELSLNVQKVPSLQWLRNEIRQSVMLATSPPSLCLSLGDELVNDQFICTSLLWIQMRHFLTVNVRCSNKTLDSYQVHPMYSNNG